MSGNPLERYIVLLDDLLELRTVGALDDEAEANFAEALHDCRLEMTAEQEAQIEGIVAQRILMPGLEHLESRT